MSEVDIKSVIEPYTKTNMRNYINKYFIRKDSKEICTRMTITFYDEIPYIRAVISGYNPNDVLIAKVDFYPYFSSVKDFKIYYLDDLKWYKSKIRNQDIIKDLQNLKTYMICFF
jgi:hypothetical protein